MNSGLFLAPGVSSNLTQIVTPLHVKDTPVQVSYLCSPGGCHMWPRPDFNNGPGDKSNSARTSDPAFIRV